MVAIKRAYNPPQSADGTRILVDRLWPRGVARESARLAQWMRELGPSNELRRFFAHDPARWPEFRARYLAELERPAAAPLLDELVRIAGQGTLTLVYGARDETHNQAVVLKELIEDKLGSRRRLT
jgi:uncharacterized protein YeaO (DUF488 family)